MTTHPEDAMTRERALEALTSLLAITGKLSSAGGENLSLRNARYELRRWGEKYNDSLDRALASAQQEPAPSADAEGELQKAWESHWHERPRQVHRPDFEAGWRAALRRYAGDGGVTDERERLAAMIEEYCMERRPGGERLVLAVAAMDVRRGRRLTDQERLTNLKRAMDVCDAEAAALAKPRN